MGLFSKMKARVNSQDKSGLEILESQEVTQIIPIQKQIWMYIGCIGAIDSIAAEQVKKNDVVMQYIRGIVRYVVQGIFVEYCLLSDLSIEDITVSGNLMSLRGI